MFKRLLPLMCFVCISYSAQAQSTSAIAQKIGDFLKSCPGISGTAKASNVVELNKSKNRADAPASIDRSITLDKLLATGEDKQRWHMGTGVEVVGYVDKITVGGVETCNCKTTDPLFRDTHINLTLEPMNSGSKKTVIVEVTPRMRKAMAEKGTDWTTNMLRSKFLGRWVKVQGWLLFDEEHADEAENTAPGRPRNWRQTAWEVHPITAIEVTDRPKSTFTTARTETASAKNETTTKNTPATSQVVQCKGTTKSGKRCTRMTADASGFCYQHKR